MAITEGKAAEKIREITECPICMSTFNDPRVLPCIHTFCLECLTCTGEAGEKKPGDKTPCPICRKEFIIPTEGMTGLQKNFFMENLKEFKNFVQLGKKTEQLEDFVFIVGLSDGWTITKDVIQINLHRPNEISIRQQIPTTMQREATAAVYRNTMYIAGIGDNANEIWKYNVASGWKKCASLVQSRRRHSAVFIDEVMYICGGFVDSDGRVLDSVETYNTVKNKCSAVGKLVHRFEAAGKCVPFKTSLYIFGGFDKDNNAMNHVQVYDTTLNSCTLLSKPMPRPYHLMRAVLWKSSAILVGCYTCFIFNFETETWHERKQFKTDCVHYGLVLESERLFVIGGGNSEKGKDGKPKWKCRYDVRYVPLRNFIEDKPVEWQFYARLPQPSLIHAYGN